MTNNGDRELPLHFLPEFKDAFFIQVEGDSMIGANIEDGDFILVDDIKPKNGDVVVASINNKRVVKRLHQEGDAITLISENPNYKLIEIGDDDKLEIHGVVTHVVKRTV